MAFGIRFSYSLLLPVMIKDLGITVTESGLIYSGYFLAYAFFSPIVGILTDRMGGKRVVTTFCGVLGIGTLMMGTIYRWQSGFVSAIVMGIGASATWTPVAAIVSNWFDAKRRGRALGIMVTGYGWGFGAMGLLLPLIVVGYGWRFCWYALAVIVLSAILVNGLLLRSKPENFGSKLREEAEDVRVVSHDVTVKSRSIFKEGEFWLIGASYLAISFATYIAMLYLVSYVNLELRIEYTVASRLASVIAFSGIPGGLAIPTLSDYLGRKVGIILCNTVLMFALFSFVSVGSNLHALIVIAVLFGLFYSGVWPIYAAYAADYFSIKTSGTVLGLWTINFGIGVTTGSAIAGYVRDVTQSFFLPFVLGSLMAGLSVALMLISRQRESFKVKDAKTT